VKVFLQNKNNQKKKGAWRPSAKKFQL